jgi:hypothetical protein
VYNLKSSPFNITIGNITFFFSSILHEKKFTERYLDYINGINFSLSKRFEVEFDIPLIGLLMCYKKIETRGFYIEIEGEPISCLSDIRLSGGKLTKSN